MRTTLDLPDPLLRSLKIQAARSGKSLKTLLNELIVRAMAMPAAPVASGAPVLPVLSRLSYATLGSAAAPSNADLDDAQLQDDLDKLRRSGFIQ
jgi:hypothetical protein